MHNLLYLFNYNISDISTKLPLQVICREIVTGIFLSRKFFFSKKVFISARETLDVEKFPQTSLREVCEIFLLPTKSYFYKNNYFNAHFALDMT